ncbi:NAD(P)/FAD-dependent oxidoreductase [Candidatus Saccharibacteria bacterium]|nr:NAD(P)/FAD-dependent oxidoreductase [Candidatus Saccharibacteria bacterium]
MTHTYDVVIVGGGAAGLSAALVLGRAKFTVVLLDEERQSNRVSHASHGVFTRDGEAPHDLYKKAHADLTRYKTVTTHRCKVTNITKVGNKFAVTAKGIDTLLAKKVILAQGVNMTLPAVEGLSELWGTKAWHCPFCDGYEYSDQKLLVIASADTIIHTSKLLPTWSKNLHWYCTEGELNHAAREQIEASGGVITSVVKSLFDDAQGVKAYFEDGSSDVFKAVVAGPSLEPRDTLAQSLGCTRSDQGTVARDDCGKTNVPGVYVAGDQTDIVQQVNVAVASGHKAAANIIEEISLELRQRELINFRDLHEN